MFGLNKRLHKSDKPIACNNVISVNPKISGINQFHKKKTGIPVSNAKNTNKIIINTAYPNFSTNSFNVYIIDCPPYLFIRFYKIFFPFLYTMTFSLANFFS